MTPSGDVPGAWPWSTYVPAYLLTCVLFRFLIGCPVLVLHAHSGGGCPHMVLALLWEVAPRKVGLQNGLDESFNCESQGIPSVGCPSILRAVGGVCIAFPLEMGFGCNIGTDTPLGL